MTALASNILTAALMAGVIALGALHLLSAPTVQAKTPVSYPQTCDLGVAAFVMLDCDTWNPWREV